MLRLDRIYAAIEACTECGGRDFPKHSDCDGCTAAVDEELAAEDLGACPNCEGSGRVFVRRNSRGQVDYIDGSPTSETTDCYKCHGEGVIQT